MSTISNVTIYDRALTKEDLETLYNGGYSFSFWICSVCNKSVEQEDKNHAESHESVDFV